MVTPREKRALAQELEGAGYAIRITGWPARTTYYKPTGEAMPGLPSDAVSLKGYLAKGFTLAPPPAGTEKPVKVLAETAIVTSGPTCNECGFAAKDEAGLYTHSRKHAKEKR